MKSKIYVINRAAHDYSGAEKWGELIYLSDGPINRYATNKIFRAFEDVLSESSPDDYILLTGLTIMSSIACAIFAHRHDKLNLLIFRPNTHSYAERRLVLNNKKNKEI